MLKQREGYKVVILEPAKTRLENNQCPGCGLPREKFKRRKDWRCCSKECTEKYLEMYYCFGWPSLRDKVLQRDNHTCVKCGDNRKEIEVTAIRKKCINLNDVLSRKDKKCKYENYQYKYIKSNFIGDHIIPIALGGDEWDLKNIQTLCTACNKIKTKEDMRKINKERKRLKEHGKT